MNEILTISGFSTDWTNSKECVEKGVSEDKQLHGEKSSLLCDKFLSFQLSTKS